MNSWSILPAAQCLFGKSKVTLADIRTEWESGVVVVCKKPNGSFHFICGSGGGSYAKIGTRVEAIHDQTFAKFGTWEVVNEIIYDKKQEFYAVPPVIGVNMVEKAAMGVFK